MTARTVRALWHARGKIDSKFRHDPRNRKLFLQILQAPQGVTRALRGMNQSSVLGRYLPCFRKIIGQMQRLMVAYMPLKGHVHRVYTDMTQPWVIGAQRNLFLRDFWQYVDIDTDLLAKAAAS